MQPGIQQAAGKDFYLDMWCPLPGELLEHGE